MRSIKDGEEELINTLLKNVIEKETIMNKSKILSFILVSSCLLFADDKAEVEDLVKKHYSYQNNKNWKKFVTTLSSDGTMNGDSNGSFWYLQESTVSAWTEGQEPGNKFNFNPVILKWTCWKK